MERLKNQSLKQYNTFGFDVKAMEMAFIQSVNDLETIRSQTNWFQKNCLVLGGGSNLLLTKSWDGPVLKIDITGIEVLHQTANDVVVRAGAGENWHQFVLWCIAMGFGGLENLSLIPGQVGAAPMQNIGAYGAEIKDTFDHLLAYRIADGEVVRFDAAACAFGYRESVFKNIFKNQYIITHVAFRLTTANHVYKTHYGAIETELARHNAAVSLQSISAAVVAIRQSKLPDPKILGNAGSFFKNPVVAAALYERITAKYPDAVGYPAGAEKVKLAAGWLIEKAGWKGFRRGPVGVHELQALVLVHYGGGQGAAIAQLASDIQTSVFEQFGVELEVEVNLL